MMLGLLFALFAAGCGTGALNQTIAGPAHLEFQLAPDSPWSKWEPYLNQYRDALRAEWEKIYVDSQRFPTAGDVVIVFKLDRQGQVAGIVSTEGSTDDYGRKLCVRAVKHVKSGGAWTPDMVATLGNVQELTAVFIYQP